LEKQQTTTNVMLYFLWFPIAKAKRGKKKNKNGREEEKRRLAHLGTL
jgi:hypothetical protein